MNRLVPEKPDYVIEFGGPYPRKLAAHIASKVCCYVDIRVGDNY